MLLAHLTVSTWSVARSVFELPAPRLLPAFRLACVFMASFVITTEIEVIVHGDEQVLVVSSSGSGDVGIVVVAVACSLWLARYWRWSRTRHPPGMPLGVLELDAGVVLSSAPSSIGGLGVAATSVYAIFLGVCDLGVFAGPRLERTTVGACLVRRAANSTRSRRPRMLLGSVATRRACTCQRRAAGGGIDRGGVDVAVALDGRGRPVKTFLHRLRPAGLRLARNAVLMAGIGCRGLPS